MDMDWDVLHRLDYGIQKLNNSRNVPPESDYGVAGIVNYHGADQLIRMAA
jgi:hypothetical protein